MSDILGIHHVTAVASDPLRNVDFYAGILGLRLVKRTVNFDYHHVHHFYYGTERGAPGMIWTTFPYKDRGVRVGAKGAGQVTVTSFSVPPGAFQFWRARLGGRGVAVNDVEPRYWHSVLTVDPQNPNIVYTNGDHSLYQSTDGGNSWSRISTDKDASRIRFATTVTSRSYSWPDRRSGLGRTPGRTVATLRP